MSRVEHLSAIERGARRDWLAGAAHHHFGQCSTCKRTHDSAGSPLYVARQRRRRTFECLDCFDLGGYRQTTVPFDRGGWS